MQKITINYLSHDRPECLSLTCKIFKNIAKHNKEKIKLNILCSQEINLNNKLNDLEIEYNIFKVEKNDKYNYLKKIDIALKADTEYSCKLDEDCFISEYTWNSIIENIDNFLSENFILAPTINNCIPSIEYFIEDFIKDKTVKDEIFNIFLNQKMPNDLWDVDYSILNKFTIDSKKWDAESFYLAVWDLNTKLKGIHPLRINFNAQNLINEYTLNNVELIFNEQKYSIFNPIPQRPYFTNSFFFIRTKDWNIIRKLISQDIFDEITLNNFMRESKQKMAFVRNGFGIHMMYNTVFGCNNPFNIGNDNAEIFEKIFYKKLEEKYDELHIK